MEIRGNVPKSIVKVLQAFDKKHPNVIESIHIERDINPQTGRWANQYWVYLYTDQSLWFDGERTSTNAWNCEQIKSDLTTICDKNI